MTMTNQPTNIYIVTTTIQGPTDASLGNDDCVIGHAAYFASREVADTFITECVEAWEENSPGLTGGEQEEWDANDWAAKYKITEARSDDLTRHILDDDEIVEVLEMLKIA